MKTIFAYDPWRLVENELHKDDMRLSESMTSIGNGHMGMRGNFEERYSGDSHRGTYLAGVWFPDKTRVGWWKNWLPAVFRQGHQRDEHHLPARAHRQGRHRSV